MRELSEFNFTLNWKFSHIGHSLKKTRTHKANFFNLSSSYRTTFDSFVSCQETLACMFNEKYICMILQNFIKIERKIHVWNSIFHSMLNNCCRAHILTDREANEEKDKCISMLIRVKFFQKALSKGRNYWAASLWMSYERNWVENLKVQLDYVKTHSFVT